MKFVLIMVGMSENGIVAPQPDSWATCEELKLRLWVNKRWSGYGGLRA